MLQKNLNKLFEEKGNSHTPLNDREIALFKNQIESLCNRFGYDLIPNKPHSTPVIKSNMEENIIPRHIEELITVIKSYKNIFGVSKYTEGEQKYILNKITNSIRKINDECMDNFRFSDGSKKSLKEYYEIRENGCCGFHDEKIELKSGKEFFFGFNFGH